MMRNPDGKQSLSLAEVYDRRFAAIIRYLLWVWMFVSLPSSSTAENWPCWRGPRLDGTSHEQVVPVHWSATSNVVWKTALPGVGHASPIVWENKVFTVTCLPEAEARVLLCLDRNS